MFLPTRLRSPSEDRDAALVNFFTIAADDDDRRSDCDRDGDGDGGNRAGAASPNVIALSQEVAPVVGRVPSPVSDEEMEQDVLAIAKAGDDLWRSKMPKDLEP